MPSRAEAPRDNVVRPHRLLADLTQAQLAERVGVSRQTVVAIESGGYAPSVYLALALARELGTTVEALFTPTDNDRPAVAARTGEPHGR